MSGAVTCIRGAGADANLPGLDLIGLRDAQGQEAVREGRFGAIAVDSDRQLEAPVEAAESALTVDVSLVLDGLIGLERIERVA